MNIDFHVHGILSKKLDFDPNLLLQEIEYGKENKLDGFVLCEHFNAKDFEVIHKYLRDNFEYKGNKYYIDGFSIFPGIEVTIKEKGHVILVGDRDDILYIRRKLEGNMKKQDLIDFESLLNLADAHNCLKIGAHPYRRGHKLYLHPEELLKRLDALDLNAKDIFIKDEEVAKEEVYTLSSEVGVNVVSGSDSHYPIQLGCIFTQLTRECSTVDELRTCIRENKYNIVINSTLKLKVFSAKAAKRYISRNKEVVLFTSL